MNRLPAILAAAVAAAIVCIVAVLGVKMKNRASVDVSTAGGENGTGITQTQSDYTENPAAAGSRYLFTSPVTEFSQTEFTPAQPSYPVTALTDPAATQQIPAEQTAQISQPEQTEQTEPSTLAEKTSAVVTTVVNTAFNKAFSMPRVPKYINTNDKIDFNTASLASYKFDPDGNYYYTNDKSAWQKGFGYNQTYDRLAIAAAMYYDTVRTTFRYENKDWLIQIWKGQYGYYFVGEEIGVYTKAPGSSGQYACADKSDWLKMEMCFVWDEDHNGNYQPRFLRPYTEYWWCTGFVIGLESSTAVRSREQFRMIAHITFKTTEMAELFANAFEANGFRRVQVLDNSVKDTFIQSGPDVAFVWQSINQHVI